MTGIELIAQERKEQIEKHGKTVALDKKKNNQQQLSFAAALLTCPDPIGMGYATANNDFSCPEGWDVKVWMKIIVKPYKDRLIIAGALLAAELDRII